MASGVENEEPREGPGLVGGSDAWLADCHQQMDDGCSAWGSARQGTNRGVKASGPWIEAPKYPLQGTRGTVQRCGALLDGRSLAGPLNRQGGGQAATSGWGSRGSRGSRGEQLSCEPPAAVTRAHDTDATPPSNLRSCSLRLCIPATGAGGWGGSRCDEPPAFLPLVARLCVVPADEKCQGTGGGVGTATTVAEALEIDKRCVDQQHRRDARGGVTRARPSAPRAALTPCAGRLGGHAGR